MRDKLRTACAVAYAVFAGAIIGFLCTIAALRCTLQPGQRLPTKPLDAGIYLPNRNANLCSRKYCAREAEFGGQVRAA
jgi:hypothetical protein